MLRNRHRLNIGEEGEPYESPGCLPAPHVPVDGFFIPDYDRLMQPSRAVPVVL